MIRVDIRLFNLLSVLFITRSFYTLSYNFTLIEVESKSTLRSLVLVRWFTKGKDLFYGLVERRWPVRFRNFWSRRSWLVGVRVDDFPVFNLSGPSSFLWKLLPSYPSTSLVHSPRTSPGEYLEILRSLDPSEIPYGLFRFPFSVTSLDGVSSHLSSLFHDRITVTFSCLLE